jgi:CheY-like chemotaxis protein
MHFIAKSDFKSAGYAASLPKPVRMGRLAMLMARVLDPAGSGGEPMAMTESSLRTLTAGESDEDSTWPTEACVLLADDNSTNQKVATQMLEKLGCAVDVASNGQQAIDMYKVGSYDLILMDCEMPEVDGFEATRRIRGTESGARRVPIIAMTANAMSGDRQRCLSAGMDDYVSKPYRLRDLQAKLEKWIGGGDPSI